MKRSLGRLLLPARHTKGAGVGFHPCAGVCLAAGLLELPLEVDEQPSEAEEVGEALAGVQVGVQRGVHQLQGGAVTGSAQCRAWLVPT